MIDIFQIGKQPCNNFIPKIEVDGFTQWENEHECFRCGGIVSFCINCKTDHHANGYESCIKKEVV